MLSPHKISPILPSSPQNNNNVSKAFGKFLNIFNKSKPFDEKEDSARQGLKDERKNKIELNNIKEHLPNFGEYKKYLSSPFF